MVTPRVRAFRERIWLVFDPKGEAYLVENEGELRSVEARVGWSVREYGLRAEKKEGPAMPVEEPFL
jgi:hypothetical protein